MSPPPHYVAGFEPDKEKEAESSAAAEAGVAPIAGAEGQSSNRSCNEAGSICTRRTNGTSSR